MGCCESTERSSPKGDGLFSTIEIEKEKKKEMVQAAKVAGALVVVGLVAWGVLSLFSSGSSRNKKVMKAPGKNGYIFREDFENDPRSYFKSLRD